MPDGRDDPLISALLGKLPATGTSWPRSARMNWLRMMVMAFNETYGLEEPIVVSDTELRAAAPTRAPLRLVPADDAAPAPAAAAAIAASAEPRYVIDEDGFAMCGTKPIAPADIPPGAVLWDHRRGDRELETILWKGVGTIAADKLPKLDVRAA